MTKKRGRILSFPQEKWKTTPKKHRNIKVFPTIHRVFHSLEQGAVWKTSVHKIYFFGQKSGSAGAEILTVSRYAKGDAGEGWKARETARSAWWEKSGSCRSFPYLESPTKGCPKKARVARIWWVRPVCKTMENKVRLRSESKKMGSVSVMAVRYPGAGFADTKTRFSLSSFCDNKLWNISYSFLYFSPIWDSNCAGSSI